MSNKQITPAGKPRNEKLRQSGIPPVGAVPWGTHFCQFYETRDDLIETLVPYFHEGLKANEFCMWITSAPLQVEEATRALKKVFPDLDRCLAKGQIEILDYSEWYTKSGAFNADEVLNGWVDKLDNALKRGFEGLRLTGNTFWLEHADWNNFTKYEETVNNVIGRYKMLAICTYSLQKCGALEVADVVANHEFALLKRAGRWQTIESSRQKQAMETLKESESRFSSIISTTLEGFWLVDQQGRFLDVNNSACQMLGYGRDELLRMKIADIEAVEKPEEVELHARKMKDAGRDFFESKHRCKDGTVIDVEVNTSFVEETDGDRIFAFIHDITDRKKKEQGLQRLNRTLRALSKSSQAMLHAKNEQEYLKEVCTNVVVDCNHKMVWIGFADEDEGKTVIPAACAGFEEGYCESLKITWADTERGRGPTGTAIRTGKPSICRNMLTDPAFAPWREQAIKRSYASSIVLPLMAGNKAFGAINIYSEEADPFTKEEVALLTELADDLSYGIMTFRARSARAEAEEKLREERSFSSAVIRTTGGLIVGLDKEGRIRLFNRACEKITGYSFDEVKGRPFWDFLLVPEEKGPVKKTFAGIMDGSVNAEIKFENYWVVKDGSLRWIRWANSALRDDRGNVELIIGTGIDITEQTMAHRKIEELNSYFTKKAAELVVINKDLEAITQMVTRGLHKPISVIHRHSSQLFDDYSKKLDKKGRELVQSLDNDVQRIERIIEKTVALSHIAHKELWLQPVDMSANAEEVVRELQEKESGRKVEIVIQKKIKAKADQALIRKALENLLENAWKFTRDRADARIEFGMQPDNEGPIYFVRDNGAGFDMKESGDIFSTFLRTGPVDDFLDAGAGLVIVERIIRRHNGKVWAESEKKKGTSIYFKLNPR
jgi:PAS domain S-box-containing protein